MTWLEHFLCNRSQFVTYNDHTSPSSSVDSGVPQGSVLGPLLFLIYINDLPQRVTSNIYLFADDYVVVREITNAQDLTTLQTDLNAISDWCNDSLMTLNNNKCKVLRVSRTASNPPAYQLNNTILESVTSYRYLGVHITSDLTWSLHINHIVNNANRTLGYLRRNFSSAPASLKLLLYKTLIRSKLEYASAVWDPSTAKLIDSLELVQNNSTRFILHNYNRTASISSM